MRAVKKGASGFTLIEILVVVSVIAVVMVVAAVILPSKIREAQDARRISDLSKIDAALESYLSSVPRPFLGTSSIVYVSLPSSSPTCADQGLPTLTGGWQYRCATAANFRKVDGTGWIPVNFAEASGISLVSLPIDPVNDGPSGLYYTYTVGSWELTAKLASRRYSQRHGGNAGASSDPNIYAVGSVLAVTPQRTTGFVVANNLTVGSISATVNSAVQITGQATFTGDANANSTTTLSRGTSAGGPWTDVCTSVTGASPRSCVMGSLTGNTNYWIRVTHSDPDGVTGTNPATSSSSFLTYPGTPGTPTFSGVTTTAMTVNWSAPTGGAASYKVERCTGSGCTSFSQIASGVATTTYSDSGLTCATTYRYRVRATNATGDGSYSASSADQATSACVANNLTVGSISATVNSAVQITGQATFTGDANANSSTAFDRATSSSGPWTNVCASVTGASPRTCVMSGLTGNTAYWIRVTHTDPDGVTGTNPSTSTSGFLTYPGTPGTPTFSGVTGTSITVNWTAPAGGASYYKIERCTGSGCTAFSQIATSSTTSYTNSGLTGNTVYRYRIRATNATGDGSYSTPAEQLTLPGTPGTPTFSGVTTTAMTVNWSAPTGGAASYKVERCTGSGCTSFSQIASGVATTTYSDSGLTCATTYRYRVRATNATGDGSYSASSADQATSACTAAGFQMQTGYYIGTGAPKSITGVGFQPEFVIVKSDTTAGVTAFKTSAMPAANTSFLGSGSADNTASQLTFNADGFTVGTIAELNSVNVRYTWSAFRGSDCTSAGSFCVGTYTGDGAASRAITSVGFSPNFAFVKSAGATNAVWRSSAMPADVSQYFTTLAQIADGTRIRTLDATGFTVGAGAEVNTSGTTYYFVAFKNAAGKFSVGTFTGDGVDNRNITGVGFKPNLVFVKNSATTTSAVKNFTETYGDYSSLFTATANAVNHIQELQADGFQVGNAGSVNASGDAIYWVAFGGAADPPAPSGTFTMARGSYSGTGSSQSISGLGFTPDLVIIKGSTTTAAVFKTSMIAGTTAYYFRAAGTLTTAITSLDANGFTVGTAAETNASGITYHWQAFGNAYRPDTKSGAADFAVGLYIGNAITNRNIIRVGFQPDFVLTKRNSTTDCAWRVSAAGETMRCDANTDPGTNILGLVSDGFTVGSGLASNGSGSLYPWFAFKTGLKFSVGTYVGNGTSQSITSAGFQPDLVWIRRQASSATAAVTRSATLAGDVSQFLAALDNAANNITAILSNGFSVGSADRVNASGANYHWGAWRP